MSVTLYSEKKFLEIYETLKPEGRDLAWLFGYPDGWDKPDGMNYYLKNFINDLYRANAITWNRQYPNDIQKIDVLDFSKRLLPYKNLHELYKSLQGLRYSLCDNDGEESDLNNCLDKLNKLIDHIALKIIQEIAAYQNANTW